MLAATIAGAALLLVASTPAAAAAGCSVKNVRTSTTVPSLQAAVDAARPRDRLLVRGTCRGRTVVDKRLTIHGVDTRRWGRARLDGGDRFRVMRIMPGARVDIRSLIIRNGWTPRRQPHGWGGGIGAGVLNAGDLLLRDVTVRRNRAAVNAGGIFNRGKLRLLGNTRVKGNHAVQERDAGIYNTEGATLVMRGPSRVNANFGRGVQNRGTFRMYGHSLVRANRAGSAGRHGGGVQNWGTLRMHEHSSITGNRAWWGGGVWSGHGLVELNDHASITGNRAAIPEPGYLSRGGGVDMGGGTLRMTGSSVITGNHAPDGGGGLYHFDARLDGVLCAPAVGANVYGNAPDDCGSH